jgi:hypothetical protein
VPEPDELGWRVFDGFSKNLPGAVEDCHFCGPAARIDG